MKIFNYNTLPLKVQKAITKQYEVFAKKEAKAMGMTIERYERGSVFSSYLDRRFWIYTEEFNLNGYYYEVLKIQTDLN